MTVTKQQQLEWMAKEFSEWPGFGVIPIKMSHNEIGSVELAFNEHHKITKQEWQQERDKMNKQDNSWHERGELPPVGCECEFRYKYLDRGFFYEWESGTILFFGDEIFVVKQGGKERSIEIKAREFRPLSTERENAIDEMIAAIDHIKEGNFQTFIGALYDAEYRKEKNK